MYSLGKKSLNAHVKEFRSLVGSSKHQWETGQKVFSINSGLTCTKLNWLDFYYYCSLSGLHSFWVQLWNRISFDQPSILSSKGFHLSNKASLPLLIFIRSFCDSVLLYLLYARCFHKIHVCLFRGLCSHRYALNYGTKAEPLNFLQLYADSP